MPAYDEVLAQQILLALQEVFPNKVSSHELKARSPFVEVPQDQWLLALDALLKLGLIGGEPLRAGYQKVLHDVANLEITRQGRESLSTAVILGVQTGDKHLPSDKNSKKSVKVGIEREDFGTPHGLWDAARKAVPSLKYALGIAGIPVLISIVFNFVGLKMSLVVAVLGVVIMFFFMALLLVFAKLARQPRGTFDGPARLLVWFVPIMAMLAIIAMFTSAFGDWPVHWRHFLAGERPIQSGDNSAPAKSDLPVSAPNGIALSKPTPIPQLPTLPLVNCQPIGTQDSISVNLALKKGPTFTSFYTEGKEQTVPFLRRPERLYVEPPGKTVAASDLPTQITLGKCGDKDCKITIKDFTDKGVVVDTGAAMILTDKRETCGVQVKMTMLDAAAKPMASAKPLPATAQPEKPPPVSAPNGIAIGGGNVTNPTVNNFGPILPIPTFKLLDKQPLPESAAPQQWIRIAIDRTFLDPKFAILCDRPCKVLRAQLLFGPNAGGVKQESWGKISNHENVAVISINQPNPMPLDDTVEAVIASEDNKPIKIIGVRLLVISPPKQ